MENNRISEITDDSLVGYGNLIKLCLSGNNIKHIDGMAFVWTRRLKELDLSSNKMEDFVYFFDNMPEFEKLDLSRNSIRVDFPSAIVV